MREQAQLNNAWLWVLGAIAFPEENEVTLYDNRTGRQSHQKDMSTNVTK